ncbi:MAG: hypothetical protein ACLP2F_08135 [Steroidobacteraceae bacterium]
MLDITGGGIDTGTINTCPGGVCGTTTAYTYASGGNVSGTITLTTSGTTGTATFDVQLTSLAQFSAGEQLSAGTFTATASIPISLSGSSWSQTGSTVYGSNSGVTFNTLTAYENAPQISGLTCSSNLKLCGFFLGPTGFEMKDSGGNIYDADIGFDVTTKQVVPLPSSVWLALSGIAFLWRARRHRPVSL